MSAADTCAGPRSLTEHAEIVRALLSPVLAARASAAPELLSVLDPALNGRVIAEQLTSTIPLPPFDNSQMDGYAVRTADFVGQAPFTLTIGQTTAAGDPPHTHVAGTAAPVMTGAPVPMGADAVIPIEAAVPPRFTELQRAGQPAATGTVSFAEAPPANQFVRRAGSDLPLGEQLVAAGTRITPPVIGLLANAGVQVVAVRQRPRVLLVSTGDEVAAAAEVSATATGQLPAGAIFDANTPMLSALFREAGAEVVHQRVPDDAERLRDVVAANAAANDLLLTSGGISAGAYEVVRDAFADYGVTFTGVAMQPGGPQGAGQLTLPTADGETATITAICFPGNPVSCALSAECFVLPALREYAGRPGRAATEVRQLAHDTVSPAHKHQLRRGRLLPDGRVRVTPPSSHLLADLAAAEVLVHIPVGVSALSTGDDVEIWRLHD
ncbi:molybdopterin molybdotransferase MoeA [Leucobacter sp. cx-42]|uniref:molybdopterin molybdotransferase MoeA n=1 Tax=unclassified Leucobacter TaxID=2621730 RepID=UPI00165E1FF9|nr:MULTISPECIES: gephyrin-like molybdotransferase Glp [unclassified Leucobacter]MBC9954311.1 molybdopterin molybdotransferase MoeA [Leucobacter sp. cx-42]